MLSNAGTFSSGLWRHYSDLGRAAVDDPTSPFCWLEWAAADDADVTDPNGWRRREPDARPPRRSLLGSARGRGRDARRVDVPPRASQRLGGPLVDRRDRPRDLGRVSRRGSDDRDGPRVAIDVTPDRDRGAIVAAGTLDDGRVAIEVIETSSDLERLVSRGVEVAKRWGAVVVVDRGGPAASTIHAFERNEVPVRLIAFPDLVRACGDFHDATVQGRIAHRGDYRLTDAVAAATKRRAGDAWVWRRRGHGDISPLVAATLARWGIVAAEVVPIPAIY